MKFFLILFSLIFTFFTLLGQNYSFVSYSTSSGLPQSQVTSVIQDSNGYLWVGTLGGLARFNGKDFITYSSESGLINNRISTLSYIDNKLWVGHQGGVTLIDKSKFLKWSLEGDNKFINVKSIIKFKGSIYIGTNGGGLFKLIKNKIVKVFLPGVDCDFIRDMQIYDSTVYIATRNGIVFTNDFKKLKTLDSMKEFNVSGIEKWSNGLIFSVFENGLFAYNVKRKNISKINLTENEIILKSLFVDSKNNCWVSTETGFYKIDKKSNVSFIGEKNGLPIGVISCVFEDHQKNIWLGTLGKGLLRFPNEKFIHFNKISGFSSDLVLNINQDSERNLWFSTFDKGVIKKTQSGKLKFIEFDDNRVWSSALNVCGSNWFGTDGGLVQIKNDKIVRTYFPKDGVPGYAITCLFKVSSNQMYVGGTDGVSFFKDGVFHFFKNSLNQKIGTVRRFSLKNNQLICATSKGLFILKKNVFIKINEIKNEVYCIEKDKKNNIWIGTEEGLFYFDGKSIKRVIVSNSPSSNLIYFLNFHNNKMYVGTNDGLYVISKFTDKFHFTIKHFCTSEGLVDLETNLNSSYFDDNGNVWFGTSSGTVKFSENSAEYANFKPQLNIKSILLNYKEFDYKKYVNSSDERGIPDDLSLPYFKNNLIFEIDGVSLKNHDHLSYSFFLEGLNETWSPKSKNTIISFTDLSSGDYNLRIKVIDDNGLESIEKNIRFTIKSPFYKTWWFYISILVLIGFLIYSIVRFKIKREIEKNENEMLEYKSKLISLEQKSLNASMNRHFIFNSLNSIQYFINSQDRISANRYLTNFAKLIRKNLDSTSEEGNMISLTQEIEGLELYLSLESMRFKDKFIYIINKHNIDTDSIIIPAMLLQPFIENSIIHGILPNENFEGKITVDLSAKNDLLTIQIDDNGIGINNSILKKSINNGDHKSQGMEITNKRIDLIKKILNKGFEIIGPYQISNLEEGTFGTRVIIKIPYENLED